MPDEQPQIVFTVVKDPGYQQHPTTGAFLSGGPSGLMSIDFYVDRPRVPAQFLGFLRGTELDEQFEQPTSPVPVDRVLVSSITVLPQTAIAIGRILVQKGEDALKQFAAADAQAKE